MCPLLPRQEVELAAQGRPGVSTAMGLLQERLQAWGEDRKAVETPRNQNSKPVLPSRWSERVICVSERQNTHYPCLFALTIYFKYLPRGVSGVSVS